MELRRTHRAAYLDQRDQWGVQRFVGLGTNIPPHLFTNTFNAAGTYTYYCGLHYRAPFFMTGAVVVATANLPPTVAITNPTSGAVFAAPANVTIQASASDSDGTVTNVQFLVDANVVTNRATAPFSALTNNLAAGSYTLSAIASDNDGATATNQVTISVVTPVSVVLSAPQPLPPGKFRFNFTANAGLSYIVQNSSNLASPNWYAPSSPTRRPAAQSTSRTLTRRSIPDSIVWDVCRIHDCSRKNVGIAGQKKKIMTIKYEAGGPIHQHIASAF